MIAGVLLRYANINEGFNNRVNGDPVLVGNITAFAMFLIYALPPLVCFAGCGVMFIDWLMQRLAIYKSTNILRMITGVIGGYSLTTLYCTAIKQIVLHYI